MLEEEFDCFGLLYSEAIPPCDKTCAVRFICRDELRKKLRSEGSEKVEEQKMQVILANESEFNKSMHDKDEKRRSVQPQVSPLVSSVIDMMKELGLTYVTRKAHIAFKVNGTNIFGITAFKSKDLQGLLKVIYSKDRSQFPETIINNVTTEKIGGYYCVEARSLDELKPLIQDYLGGIIKTEKEV